MRAPEEVGLDVCSQDGRTCAGGLRPEGCSAWWYPEGNSAWGLSSLGGTLRNCQLDYSSYDGDLSLPLGLALGSPIFPSGCEGKLGVALESLQGLRDLSRKAVRAESSLQTP